MEQDKNKRLDDLFNQAKNEPSKVSFEETKGQFVNSTRSITNVSKGGKLAQFSNLKTLIMITTISAITIGASIFVYNFSEPNNNDYHTKVQETSIADSTLIIEEHEEVVKEYLDRVEAVKAHFPLGLLVPNELTINISDITLEQLDTLKKRQEMNNGISGFEVDTSYRFPQLNYEELKAQKKQKEKMLKQLIKFEKKKYAFIPSGSFKHNKKMISVHAFYMQTTEVSNLEYRTFLFDLLQQGREADFLIAKPDQTRWVKDYPYSFNKPMEEHYFSHPAYNDYPVVAVSREGAKMYCEWLTMETNKKMKVPINDLRIPSSYEWMHAASVGGEKSPYPWGGPYLRNAKGEFLANFKPSKGNYKMDGAFHTAKTKSYPPNHFGLYDMAGNVAEMVIINNKAGTKGGSWTSIGQELQVIDGEDRFKGMVGASVDIGFRPVIAHLGVSSDLTYQADISITPPGTVKLSPQLYFDKTEISNFNWQEYVLWQVNTYGKGSKQHRTALPDTLVWKSTLTYNEPYVKHYFNHPAYNNYPVVGITYEQAVAFCKWRTDRVKELFELQKVKNKKAIYPTKFEYRLPTKQEWERMANIGYSEKMMKKIVGKYKGKSLANYKRGKGDKMGVAGDLNDNADITAPVESYFPNALGCYNLIGNVAEMINVKGTAKGGSWRHDEKEISIENNIKYTKQNSWTGFRCVFEVLD